jgi:protein O-GlcNAc transferase
MNASAQLARAEELSALGGLELRRGELDAGIQHLESAAQLAPDQPAYHSNLGLAYHRRGRLEQAEATLLRAVQLGPELFEANDNLGRLLYERGQLDAALLCFRRAADLRPDSFAVQAALARTLRARRQLELAVGHFQCALALSPENSELALELAAVLHELGRSSGALVLLRELLAANPALARAHAQLGSLLLDQRRYDAAIEALERALQLEPALLEASDRLGYALRNLGRVPEALQVYRRALATPRPAESTSPIQDSLVHSSLVYMAAFDPDARPEQILAEARAWAERHAKPLYSKQHPHSNLAASERRLRVGYVSPDFVEHCQNFFLTPVFTHHDRSAVELVCYSSTARPDERTAWYRAHADLWRDVQDLEDAALAERVRDDGIDILVDLTMHMANGRLPMFAEKPAPVQISWLAYPGTTGVEAIDYRLTDRFLDPPGQPLPYSEESLYLPDAFWCYDPLTREPQVNALPALQAGHVTFGCLNDFVKVHGGVLELWSRVLAAVPDSRLLMLAPHGSARHSTLHAFEQHGIAPARIEFVERQPRARYLETYGRIDLALDCLPANGHTTSFDALWMGVPVVTLLGSTVLGRAGACQAEHLGLPELIACTAEQFVASATGLGQNWARLGALRQGLRARLESSPLMDGARFTRALEATYREAWRRWCTRVTS